jgi:beta-glucosidase/6-phospho-beta-glucosidase/beta-galactosidase
MRKLGLPSYRFSISWSRLLPSGRGKPNPEAVKFYGGLIDALVENGIIPLVTIFHWDLPQCLEDEYGGWLGKKIVSDFENYAATCFQIFGDKVQYWITLNEPWCMASLGYASGEHAPGHSHDPAREPYLAAHHMILAHARAVQRYRAEFQKRQKGKIGITLNSYWKEAQTSSQADMAAQRRALDWELCWFAEPIFKGDYPVNMRRRCGDRLPQFTRSEKAIIKGTSDFLGVNHYSTSFVCAPPPDGMDRECTFFEDKQCDECDDEVWPRTDIDWGVVPWGLKSLCEFIQREYSPKDGIIITENGFALKDDDLAVARCDNLRVVYVQQYLAQLHKAIQGGVDVRGYFLWSLLDNFEWQHGYTKRFGIVHVDYETQVRTPKASAEFFTEVARTNALRIPAGLLAASDFAPLAKPRGGGGDPQQEGPVAPVQLTSPSSPQRDRARANLKSILRELQGVRRRIVNVAQGRERGFVAEETELLAELEDEAQAVVAAIGDMVASTDDSGSLIVYDDTDAFSSQGSCHVEKVDPGLPLEECIRLGIQMCQEFDVGGFSFFQDKLYFKAFLPDELERGRVSSPGCTLVVVRRS